MHGYLIAMGVLLVVGTVALAAPKPPRVPTTTTYRSISLPLRVDEASIPGLCRRLCSTGTGTTSALDWGPGEPVTRTGDRMRDAQDSQRRAMEVRP